MYEQTELAPLVKKWEAEGKWIDLGSWQRARNEKTRGLSPSFCESEHS